MGGQAIVEIDCDSLHSAEVVHLAAFRRKRVGDEEESHSISP
jgi:hypothetical protein